ncbi:hypothetical protein PCLA_16r0045 [Pseudomonas citronellolis]|nr:hypothetical protein PCLA_16r0045 [Pseudomonas citronellolis]
MPDGADCAHAPCPSLTCQRHLHAYRDLPPGAGAARSETDVVVSPMDKAPQRPGRTLPPAETKVIHQSA